MLTKKNQRTLHDLKKEFLSLQKDKESLLMVLNEVEIPEAVYNSNAIENSTLSISETEQILLDLEISRNISLREIFEAKNLAKVTEYIYKNKKKLVVDTQTMLLLHKMLIANIDDTIAGRFRESDEYVRVGKYVAPGPEEIENLIDSLLSDYENNDTDTVSSIANFHLFFEKIHPFIDGNGRIGRVLINLMLLKNNFPPIIIRNSEKQYYYDAFKLYDNGKKEKALSNFSKIIFLQLSESLNKRIAYLRGDRLVTLVDFSKTISDSKNSLLNKAKRQTIPAFREKGVWKIGVEK